MPRRHGLVSFALAFFLACECAFAQRDLGTVSGTVTDAQGAAIPSAKVTLVNDATNVVNNTQTNDAGAYNVPALTPGTYTITMGLAASRKHSRKTCWSIPDNRLRSI
jgi:hypothetical protein